MTLPSLPAQASTSWYPYAQALDVRARGMAVDVRAYGAVGDGTTDDTTAIQNAINALIAAGGGTLIVRDGVYRFTSLSITGTGNVNLTIQGQGQAVLYAAPLSTSDAITIASGAASVSDPFIRRVQFRDLRIQGNTNWNSGTKRNSRGVVVSAAQDISFENVWISQFKNGGLVLIDCFDSTWHNVQVVWCGHGTSAASYAYAVQITGALDNSNANHFTSCHTEFTPLTMDIDDLSRHNYFTNCKFEHGSETETNNSGLSPFHFGQCIEIGFANCFFTKNKQDDIFLMTSDATTDAYFTTYALRKHISFVGCDFFATSAVKARWWAGSYGDFRGCLFQRCDGATPYWAMDLAFENDIAGCRFAFADAGAGWVRITGARNTLTDNRIFTASSGTGNSVYTIGSAATFNMLRDNLVAGSASSTIATTLTDLGTNIVENRYNTTRTVSGGGTPSTFANELLVLNDATAQTYTNFLHASDGARLMVQASTGNSTVAHNSDIVLKGGANKTLASGESILLLMASGVWREV